jgi:hypothetical protein
VSLKGVGDAGWWVFSPDCVDQFVGRDDVIRVEEEDCQQSPWFCSPDGQLLSATPYLERTQKPKLER